MTETAVQQQDLVCQVCGGREVERVLDLGFQPLCNEFVPAGQAIRPQIFYPLCLCYCHPCSLTQLDYVIATNRAFGDQYTYLTGSSKSLVEYYSNLATNLVSRHGLVPGDVVIDVGSNDGTFLKAFQALGLYGLGIEGAKRPADRALKNGVPTLCDFFRKGISKRIKEHLPENGRIRLVVAMNVLAHTDNINEFLPEVAALMDTDTIFVSQSHWLSELVRQFEFDTIYHEHLRYYTLESLVQLFRRHDLNIIDAEIVEFYGGSILVHADKGTGDQSSGVASVLSQEREIDTINSIKDMKRVLLRNKVQLLNLLTDLKLAGKRVIGVGAPMKASTLLNFYGVTADLVEYIAEVNELKVGTVVPGVGIPVIHEDKVFENPPDYSLILSWNMSKAIMRNYRSAGYTGKFILPVPRVEVIE